MTWRCGQTLVNLQLLSNFNEGISGSRVDSRVKGTLIYRLQGHVCKLSLVDYSYGPFHLTLVLYDRKKKY